MTEHLTLAVSAAKAAARHLLMLFEQRPRVEAKYSSQLLTDADLLAEKAILEVLEDRHPDHSIVSEESGIKQAQSPFTWYVDPLDGTTNFITGCAYFSVSIALARDDEIVAATVLNPVTDELYTATRGGGSYLNGQRIQCRETDRAAVALVGTDLSVNKPAYALKGQSLTEVLNQGCRAVVINRAPALDLCNIARGRLDALIDNGSRAVDHAAGSLVLSEAKGRVRNFLHPSWSPATTGIIAAAGPLLQPLVNLLGLPDATGTTPSRIDPPSHLPRTGLDPSRQHRGDAEHPSNDRK
ncbi:inositol monophosphatase family protein [Amycolatopsis sp. CB00013]|uniref:inositol monophosphatase family protein n=1 Tax=Amycolatopsis sp. CB00013 TaxID=1703945 RepID=UPI000A7554DC|nr:inositol monophosphatase [Amycolatopsis sp. CB00013]